MNSKMYIPDTKNKFKRNLNIILALKTRLYKNNNNKY